MQIIFDLQEQLKNLQLGNFDATGYLQARGEVNPTLTLCENQGERSIHVTHRQSREDGVIIPVLFYSMLLPGDRITLTGRMNGDVADNYWGIALCSTSDEGDQLAQQIAPQGEFSLSHQLEATDLSKSLVVKTTKWRDVEPNYDFFIDSIKVSRDDEQDKFKKDAREIVYDLNTDYAVQQVNLDIGGGIDASTVLRLSGNPNIAVFEHHITGKRGLHIAARERDFDGLDIRLSELQLIPGNEYDVKIIGRTAGAAPIDSQIMIQGMPGYHWRSLQSIGGNQDFMLGCTLRKSAVEKWNAIRIATNEVGSNIAYFIYSIVITPA